jgi:hypothetical protein
MQTAEVDRQLEDEQVKPSHAECEQLDTRKNLLN